MMNPWTRGRKLSATKIHKDVHDFIDSGKVRDIEDYFSPHFKNQNF
jgi:hypothetical protein